MNKVTINPSVAAVINIDAVGAKEVVPIYFTAEQNWLENFSFKLWNSEKKNSEVTILENPLTFEDTVMTLTISPENQNINAGKYYYEIIDTENERVIFKGDLIIID